MEGCFSVDSARGVSILEMMPASVPCVSSSCSSSSGLDQADAVAPWGCSWMMVVDV
jgi:hypothetical protein